MDDTGFGSLERQEVFLFSKTSRPAMGPTQLPIHWMSGALILRLKQHDLKVDHSPPCAEVKNEWRYTFTPPIHLQGVDRDNFSFNGPCLVLRSGIVLCAEVAVCGQARYGREAFLKLSVSLHENYFFHKRL